MGFSEITRYNLFMESGDLIGSNNEIIRFKNPSMVRDMYYESANIIRGFEERINNDNLLIRDEYLEIFSRNADNSFDKSLVSRIEIEVRRKMERKTQKEISSKDSFKIFFNTLLNAIAEYQEEVIMFNFSGVADHSSDRPQTFLSYAYYDKGLTQALFYYFWIRSGFLYVNWMWNGLNNHSSITKAELENELIKSNQLLFLRTTNSEFRIRGNNQTIRQWCAWEIGNFYTKHKDEKFYTSFYDKAIPRNNMLDTFKPMRTVCDGAIQ